MLKLFAAAAMGALVGMTAVQAAPIEAYGRLPALQNVEISPDGSALAAIITNGDDQQIIVRSLAGQILATAAIGHRKVRSVQWADAGHLIIMSSSTAGIQDTTYVGEQVQAVSLTVKTGATASLPGRSTDNVLNTIQGRLRPGLDGGGAVVYTPLYVTVQGNMQRGSGHLDLFKIDLETGMARRQQMGDNDTYDYLATPDGSVVAKASFHERPNRDDAIWTLSLRKGSGWLTAVTETVNVDTPDIWGLSPDGASVLIDTWDEKTALWRPTPVSLADGKVGDFIAPAREQKGVIGADGVVLAYSYFNGFLEYDFIEPRLKALWPAYRNAFKNQQVTLASWTPDFGKLVLFVEGGQSAGAYYLADTVTKKVDMIGAAYPGVPAREVGSVRAIRYPAADGLEIEAYLTLPPGRAEKNLPLIVLPHGGPRARDDASFDYVAQALVAQGYAVLKPNFRGSTGYGHKFVEAGYGEWGGKMQTDLSDGVAYLAKQGVIDPKRVCIMGSSYGGYAALAGVTLQKGVYRCSVAVSAVSDVGRLMRDDVLKYGERNATVRDEKRLFAVDSLSDPKLDARSPDEHADAADAPILLIHGKDDTVVPFAHAQVMAAALKKAGKPFEFVVLDHEDHWMSSSATRLQKLTAAITFLRTHNPPD